MEVIANVNHKEYICKVSHEEIEKFLNLYYGKLKPLNIGEEVNLGIGYDHSKDIQSAMDKTQEFIISNQTIINAIMTGLQICPSRNLDNLQDLTQPGQQENNRE